MLSEPSSVRRLAGLRGSLQARAKILERKNTETAYMVTVFGRVVSVLHWLKYHHFHPVLV